MGRAASLSRSPCLQSRRACGACRAQRLARPHGPSVVQAMAYLGTDDIHRTTLRAALAKNPRGQQTNRVHFSATEITFPSERYGRAAAHWQAAFGNRACRLIPIIRPTQVPAGSALPCGELRNARNKLRTHVRMTTIRGDRPGAVHRTELQPHGPCVDLRA